MGRGVQKRIQPDIVDRVEQYEGGTFSERLRHMIADLEAGSSSLSTDDIDETVSDVLRRDLPEILREVTR